MKLENLRMHLNEVKSMEEVKVKVETQQHEYLTEKDYMMKRYLKFLEAKISTADIIITAIIFGIVVLFGIAIMTAPIWFFLLIINALT